MNIVVLGSLLALSVLDIVKKSLPLVLLLGLVVCSLIYRLAIPYGAIPGLVLLFVSLLTSEAVGKGDGLVLIAVGIYTGFWAAMTILCLALFLCSFINLCRLVLHKINRKDRVAFIPYLTLAFMGVMFIG